MLLSNFRFDEFLGLDQSILITGEGQVIPGSSPYYVDLNELPRQEVPTTLLVRNAGATTTLGPTDDAWTDEGNPTLPHGSGVFNAAGRDDAGLGSWIYRTALKFDISSGPAVASSVKLRVYRLTGQNAPTYGIHRLLGAFSQSTLTHATQPGNDPVADGQFTIVPGQMGWYEADITTLYNSWKDGTYTNYGVMLRTEEIDTNTVSNWASTENSSPSLAPQLVIVGGGSSYQELAYTVAPGPGQVAVCYDTGRMRFHAADATKAIEVDYRGLGSPIRVNDWYVPTPPATATSPGRKGQYSFDAGYQYNCFDDNQWARVAHATW